MFVKNINDSVPKRESEENTDEKHNDATIWKKNRHHNGYQNQNNMTLKRLHADFESLKIIKAFKKNQRRYQ